MEKIVIYDFLMALMLWVLFRYGGKISRSKRLFSRAGWTAIVVYTLNEGLRFGRGIDYNAYWKVYEKIANGRLTEDMDFGFVYFAKTLSSVGLPWQGCVLIMNFLFIVSSLCFLRNYNNCLKYALPLWVLFSYSQTENVMRWFTGFSFILVGLALLQRDGKRKFLYFMLLSAFGCIFHFGLIPVPILFLIFTRLDKPLASPVQTIFAALIVLGIMQYASFKGYVELFNYFALMSDRFSGYANDTEYWLTKASSVGSLNNLGGILDFVLSLFMLSIGYDVCKRAGKNYVFAYNLFLISCIFRPLTAQMELLNRYDTLIYTFRALVYAIIIKHTLLQVKLKRQPVWYPILIFVVGVNLALPLITPLRNDPRKYLYVWDSKGITADKMYDVYINDRKQK